jgi:hypothetical protein
VEQTTAPTIPSDPGAGSPPAREALTLPEVAAALGVALREVRSAVADRRLLAVRRGAGRRPVVPAAFLVPGPEGRHEVLPSLRGTLTVLADAGLTDEEAVDWLCTTEESLGVSPVAALRAGRTKAVRRLAQTL